MQVRTQISAFFYIVFLFIACTRVPLVQNLSTLRSSIFRITVTSQAPDWDKPWTNEKVITSYGSGFYIGSQHILTNAHVVKFAKQITLKGDRDPNIMEAHVTFVANDCDLALLTVDDPKYFKGKTPISLGEVPELSSKVTTVGYPSGNQELAVTEGVVSRLAYRTYSHPALSKHLLIQVDSAQNPGNSGGPVLQNGKAIGIAFQGARTLESTNFVIPIPIVKRFLRDIEDGHYDGEMQLDLSYSEDLLLNPSVREYLGMSTPNITGGVTIGHISPWSPFAAVLREYDVLLALDSLEVATDGTVPMFKERLPLDAYIDLKNWGDKISIQYMRSGSLHNETLVLTPPGSHFEPRLSFEKPKYVIYAGHVFTTLTFNYLLTFGRKWYDEAPLLLKRAFWDFEEEKDLARMEELVILSRRLPHKYTKYSGVYLNNIVVSIDDIAVQNLSHFNTKLKEKIAIGKPFFLNFWRGEKMGPLLLDPRQGEKVHQQILQEQNIEHEIYL